MIFMLQKFFLLFSNNFDTLLLQFLIILLEIMIALIAIFQDKYETETILASYYQVYLVYVTAVLSKYRKTSYVISIGSKF